MFIKLNEIVAGDHIAAVGTNHVPGEVDDIVVIIRFAGQLDPTVGALQDFPYMVAQV
nr:hypothetical protein [Ruegeria atlantica]